MIVKDLLQWRLILAADEPGGGFGNIFVMFAPLMIVFYLLIIRPENKRKKEKESLLAEVKTKDKVLMLGGLIGTVVDLDGDELVLLVDPKKDVKMRFKRSAIDSVIIEPAQEKK